MVRLRCQVQRKARPGQGHSGQVGAVAKDGRIEHELIGFNISTIY